MVWVPLAACPPVSSPGSSGTLAVKPPVAPEGPGLSLNGYRRATILPDPSCVNGEAGTRLRGKRVPASCDRFRRSPPNVAQRAPGWVGRVLAPVVVVAPFPKIGTLIDLTDRAVNEYWRIELMTVWNGAARRSMKIVVRTIGSR